ncbi:hypothetical protein [Natrarchaeobius chitinivorans]|uniref:Uncharacterized protein n=1 Tax=Natrarchaeobius chitinivorans TaxID=1679083 RepID=A0A3N6PCQ3_NATCH|nr:hypothetical protein [Natrarchaeobius chitinivorans]RQG97299.1 hypothetical protein EA473_04335 [Natrarchaeobius chitinivorans]
MAALEAHSFPNRSSIAEPVRSVTTPPNRFVVAWRFPSVELELAPMIDVTRVRPEAPERSIRTFGGARR